jgi:hypothetical protein
MCTFDCHKIGCLAAVLALLPIGTLDAAKPTDTVRILFVGNSYTYVNNLPAMLAALSRSGRRPIRHDHVTKGGFTLEKHVDSGAVAKKIKASDWDYVVLQEQSQLPLVNPRAMHASVRRLHKLIDDSGAQMVFFLTWAREHRPSMQEGLNKAYLDIAGQLDATVAPVGMAWAQALAADPELKLHSPDKSHPSQAGTYLSACVFYAVIHGQSPVGLPGTCARLTDRQARPLQQVAWQVVQQRRQVPQPAAAQ